MSSRRLYLDWNATAPISAPARAAMIEALDVSGNPSSVHREGRAARGLVEAARRKVASLVGGVPANVVFTSGATEAAAMLLSPDWTMGRASLRAGCLLVSDIEHKAFREGGTFPAERKRTIRATADGTVDLGHLAESLAAHDQASGPPLVAIQLANNETGVIQPVADAASLVRKAGGILVCDAVQAAGRIAIDLAALDADFIVISSHKIGGPKGVGAIVGRGEMLWPKPLIAGGGQEKGHRSGTENVAGIAGFGAAAEAAGEGIDARAARMAEARDRIEAGFLAVSPETDIIGRNAARLANTLFFAHPVIKAETGQIAFDLEGIALSAGSACSSGKVGESHVLKAMGRPPGGGALRISLGPEPDLADCDRVVEAYRAILARIGRQKSAA